MRIQRYKFSHSIFNESIKFNKCNILPLSMLQGLRHRSWYRFKVIGNCGCKIEIKLELQLEYVVQGPGCHGMCPCFEFCNGTRYGSWTSFCYDGICTLGGSCWFNRSLTLGVSHEVRCRWMKITLWRSLKRIKSCEDRRRMCYVMSGSFILCGWMTSGRKL